MEEIWGRAVLDFGEELNNEEFYEVSFEATSGNCKSYKLLFLHSLRMYVFVVMAIIQALKKPLFKQDLLNFNK